MMKTILFTFAFVTLALAGVGATNNAYACNGKPCSKCAKMMKKDGCKKPCCAKAKASGKPCMKCAKSKKGFSTSMKKRSDIFFNE